MILKKGTYVLMRVTDNELDNVLEKVLEFPIYQVLDVYHHKVKEDEELYE